MTDVMNLQALSDDHPEEMAVRPQIQVRHEWYQTDALVVVSLLTRNLKAGDVNVRIGENTVDFTAKMTDSDDDCSVHLDLAHQVTPSLSSWKRFTSKVEIKLTKAVANVWSQLERQSPLLPMSSSTVTDSDSGSNVSYPSSSVHRRDWDKIAADIGRLEAQEQVDGEAGVNKLFQDLYEGGSDEVRRAMNKSFMESGGTVLSTNWNEVGNKIVTMKPPDGVEFKKWDA